MANKAWRLRVGIFFVDPELDYFPEFDPDDELRTCEQSMSCTFKSHKRSDLFEHYRQAHHYMPYGGTGGVPLGLRSFEVGEEGGYWESEEVWQDPDFWARGYDHEWWDHATIQEGSGTNVGYHDYELRWIKTREKIVELWELYGTSW